MKRHVTCFVEKAGFEPRTLGTKAERHDHCATRPVYDIITLYMISYTISQDIYVISYIWYHIYSNDIIVWYQTNMISQYDIILVIWYHMWYQVKKLYSNSLLLLLTLSLWQHKLVPDVGEGQKNAQNQLSRSILVYISRQQPRLQGFDQVLYQGCQAHPEREIDLHNQEHLLNPWTYVLQNLLQLAHELPVLESRCLHWSGNACKEGTRQKVKYIIYVITYDIT